MHKRNVQKLHNLIQKKPKDKLYNLIIPRCTYCLCIVG